MADMPADELARYGTELGLEVSPQTPRGELLRVIRQHQELLLEIDRNALLDIVVWARRPVRESVSKEQLAREIATIHRMRFDGLSDSGLSVLAKLRGVPVDDGDRRRDIIKRLKQHEGIWNKLGRKSRGAVGKFIAQVIEGQRDDAGEYHFLPEDKPNQALREHIEEDGVVSGIARKLRGAADVYVHEKLDEIEARIDRKLDEIDQRLAEWRDREVSNRLRIIKITLVASVLVALLSLGYDYFIRRPVRMAAEPTPGVIAEPQPAQPSASTQTGSQ
jgi:hypothetical protein